MLNSMGAAQQSLGQQHSRNNDRNFPGVQRGRAQAAKASRLWCKSASKQHSVYILLVGKWGKVGAEVWRGGGGGGGGGVV